MYTKDELTQMDQQQLIELAESMNIKVKNMVLVVGVKMVKNTRKDQTVHTY
mgnify:CR=1 FL=1